jgi:hypothetical protein
MKGGTSHMAKKAAKKAAKKTAKKAVAADLRREGMSASSRVEAKRAPSGAFRMYGRDSPGRRHLPTANFQRPRKLPTPNAQEPRQRTASVGRGRSTIGPTANDALPGNWELDLPWALEAGCWKSAASARRRSRRFRPRRAVPHADANDDVVLRQLVDDVHARDDVAEDGVLRVEVRLRRGGAAAGGRRGAPSAASSRPPARRAASARA